VPLGAYAELTNGQARLRGFVASPDGARMVYDEISGLSATPPATLGAALAERLIAKGAREILAALNG
jgi:hydroxymethylbilane synthase